MQASSTHPFGEHEEVMAEMACARLALALEQCDLNTQLRRSESHVVAYKSFIRFLSGADVDNGEACLHFFVSPTVYLPL